MAFTLKELADQLHARLQGDPELVISRLASLNECQPGDITHLSSANYRHLLAQAQASAIIISPEDLALWPGEHALVVKDPYLAFAKVSQLFSQPPGLTAEQHSSAVIHPQAKVHADAAIGPGVHIGANTSVAAGARLFANVVVMERCQVGSDVTLMPNVTLYPDVTLGPRSVVHSGAVIGSEGFGFAPDASGQMQPIAQLGGVRIGADVSIGSATTIDRGALDDTVVEDGVKIDNQVQIGHNCHIGAHSVICGCVGIVGSTRIGKHVTLAGGVGVGGTRPIQICDGVVVSGMTHISGSISEPGVYSGGVLHSLSSSWKRNALRFQQLDGLAKRLGKLEKLVPSKKA